MKKLFSYLLALILAGFGMLTLFLTCSILFDLFGIRAKEGNYVLFIVWSNFICGILYLFSAYGFATAKKWTAQLLVLAAIILLAAFVGLLIYVNMGGIHEKKTIYAMIFRISVTTIFAVLAYFIITKKKNSPVRS